MYIFLVFSIFVLKSLRENFIYGYVWFYIYIFVLVYKGIYSYIVFELKKKSVNC